MNVNIFQPNWEWVQPDNQTSAISHRKVPDPLADWGFFYCGSRVFGIRWALGRPGTSPDTSFAAQYAGGQWEDFFHRKLGTEPGYWCPHALLDARQYKFSSSADLVEASWPFNPMNYRIRWWYYKGSDIETQPIGPNGISGSIVLGP